MRLTLKKHETYAAIGLGIFYNNWILSFLLNPKLSYTQSYVSELDAFSQPHHWFFRIGNFIGASLLLACFSILLSKRSVKDTVSQIFLTKIFFVISAAALINACFPMDCSASQSMQCLQEQQRYMFSAGQWVHLFMAIVMFGGLIFANFYVVFFMKSVVSRRILHFHTIFFVLQILLNIILGVISLTGYGPIGLVQRASLVVFEVWVMYLLFYRTNYFIEFNKKI